MRETDSGMIPFFVADRPMSLRILKGLPLQQYPGVRIGIMAHANTTLNFQKALKEYPCDDLARCDAIGGKPCPYQNEDERSECEQRKYIREHTIKMCDSGIFTREGATLSYEELFAAYARMDVKYGIMIDVFQQCQATLENAKEAIKAYEPYKNKDSFKLVGVAQGESEEEYLNCYEQLKQLGFEHIAVGGLLRRTKNTVRYVSVRNEKFMFWVLAELRKRYQDDWLFALGCLSPTRIHRLKELKVWADYKGWIFQYKKRNETLNFSLKNFVLNYLNKLNNQDIIACFSSILNMINNRDILVIEQEKLSKQLHQGRLELRATFSSIYQDFPKDMPEILIKFKKITTYGLLSKSQEGIVNKVLDNLGKQGSEEAEQILKNIQNNRHLSEQIKGLEDQLNQINSSIAEQLARLAIDGIELPIVTKQSSSEISRIIEMGEQDHRLEQVRNQISERILTPLLLPLKD